MIATNRVLILVVFAATVVCGCGGAGYNEVPVSGQVTYNGQPMANIHLSFQPIAKDKSGFGPGSFGRTDQDGRFELRTVYPDAPGAVPGKHRVTISYEDPTQQPRDVRIPRDYVEGTAEFLVPDDGTDEALIAIASGK